MYTVNLYSSVTLPPASLGCLLGLDALGVRVELRPLAALPARPKPCRRRASLRAELRDVDTELAAVGDRLTAHQDGHCRLDAGTEQGLLFTRDALQSRKRGIEAALQEGGVDQ